MYCWNDNKVELMAITLERKELGGGDGKDEKLPQFEHLQFRWQFQPATETHKENR